MTTTKDHTDNPALEPTLEDLAIEAAMLLESLPTYVSDSTIRRAQQMAFALRSCVASRAPVAAVVDDEALAAMFDELFNCYTASKCAVTGSDEFHRENYHYLKGMAEAYQDAARRCREWPARRRNDGSLIAAPSLPAQRARDTISREQACDKIEALSAEWERLGDYGTKPGYGPMIRAANAILDLLHGLPSPTDNEEAK